MQHDLIRRQHIPEAGKDALQFAILRSIEKILPTLL